MEALDRSPFHQAGLVEPSVVPSLAHLLGQRLGIVVVLHVALVAAGPAER